MSKKYDCVVIFKLGVAREAVRDNELKTLKTTYLGYYITLDSNTIKCQYRKTYDRIPTRQDKFKRRNRNKYAKYINGLIQYIREVKEAQDKGEEAPVLGDEQYRTGTLQSITFKEDIDTFLEKAEVLTTLLTIKGD